MLSLILCSIDTAAVSGISKIRYPFWVSFLSISTISSLTSLFSRAYRLHCGNVKCIFGTLKWAHQNPNGIDWKLFVHNLWLKLLKAHKIDAFVCWWKIDFSVSEYNFMIYYIFYFERESNFGISWSSVHRYSSEMNFEMYREAIINQLQSSICTKIVNMKYIFLFISNFQWKW